MAYVLRIPILLLFALPSAWAGPSLPSCTAEQGLPKDTCHDVALEDNERGRLCVRQYAPYVRSRVRGGWGPRRYLNSCRFEVRLTTEKPGRKPVVRFAHSYEKNGNVLTRKSRSFFGKPSLQAPETLTFHPSVDSEGTIRAGSATWRSASAQQGAYDGEMNRIRGDAYARKLKPAANACSDCREAVREVQASTYPLSSRYRWLSDFVSSPQVDKRPAVADESESTPPPDGAPTSWKPVRDPREGLKPWRRDLVMLDCAAPGQRVRFLTQNGGCDPSKNAFTREMAEALPKYAEICARRAYPSAFDGKSDPVIDIMIDGDVPGGRGVNNGGSCDPGNLSYHSAAMAADIWKVRIGERTFDYLAAYQGRNGARRDEWEGFWGAFATCMGSGKSSGRVTFDEIWDAEERPPAEGPFWVITAENAKHRNHMHVNLEWGDTQRAPEPWMDRFSCYYLANRSLTGGAQ